MKHANGMLRAAAVALVFSVLPAVAQLAPADLSVAEANFKKADAGGTGKLTADEFKTFIDLNADAKIGYSKAFAAVDADKDGTITWAEYTKAQGN
jgi:Ca2+-binding EF-hand superfamily protein